ncbi:MAG TPA: protein kinase [Polyangiales bacterium]|nr:protein kinase [Polyangiales bacterium]
MTLPARIGERYSVLAQLGRGGSAYVYHVRDLSNDRELALKRLRHDLPAGRTSELTRHLEREFYALAQLRHPRVIEVHDYAVSDGLPYYTMELLDGGDVRASAPLPWQQACELIYDVASSLALLHSRRLVHRDVTPSNIRRTREGRAKLLDFGAMAQMGAAADVIGTPAYVAPEVQQRGVLDAGADLFSLGATLYFMLTGRPPFAPAELAAMPASWAVPPLPPSQHAPQLPAALDALVLSLLHIDPAHRPRTAFEVMHRLAAIAEVPISESANVSQGYLSAPQVVGRDRVLRSVRSRLRDALDGKGAAVWLEGDAGVGRTRLLELCTLEAKTAGACVLRLDASQGGAPLAVRLTQAFRAALPELARSILPDSSEVSARRLLELSRTKGVVVAIDDVQRVDESSLAWLAGIAQSLQHSRLLMIVTADSEAMREPSAARELLKRHSAVVPVQPLTHEQSDALFASVFGSVPNLALVSERIFALAAGNPRRSLALAQFLVDQGHISYAAGAWSLPEELATETLAVRVEALFAARIARLGSLARRLAETQALSLVAALRREDYQVLAPDVDERSLDDALSELIAHEIVRSDGQQYVLAQRAYVAVLEAQMERGAHTQRHAALARLAERQQRHSYVVAYHRLSAGQEPEALELILAAPVDDLATVHDLDAERVSAMLESAARASVALRRPQRERFEVLWRLVAHSVLAATPARYYRAAPELRARLEQDAGLTSYRAHAEIADPAERLRIAVTETAVRYANTPEHERVYPVEEAVRLLARYVIISIAVGSRVWDVELIHGLPELVEPFAALSPLLTAIWRNAEAVCDAMFRGRPDRAIERWLEVHELLEPNAGIPRMDDLRNAIVFGLGQMLATLGQTAAAMPWIERLDRERLLRVNAMRLRAVVCLQHGDWEGAARAREQAEIMGLQASGRQMFDRPLPTELLAHWLARDLAGVKQVLEAMDRLAFSGTGWYRRLGEGYFDALRGDDLSALQAIEDCVTHCQPDPGEPARDLRVWVVASAAAVGTLLQLGRTAEARARGERVLSQCRERGIDTAAQPVECELALAEARSGEESRAIERVERVLADQQRRGVSGLQLAATYETRARIAMTAGREADVIRYAALAAREYRHGASASVASRYGRLLQEARSAGVKLPAEVNALATALAPPARDAESSALERALEGTPQGERPRRLLELLCERANAEGGYLFVAQGPASDLTQAATNLDAPPSAALLRFANAYWQQQLEDAELSALLTELPWSHDTYRPGNWSDPHGDCYETVVLYEPHATPPHVGLALLHVGIRPRANGEWPTALLATLAAGLARSSHEVGA